MGRLIDKINRLKIECVYAVLMAIFGVTMVFVTPPLQVPDDTAHYARVYQISEGGFRSALVAHMTNAGEKYFFHAYLPRDLTSALNAVSPGDLGALRDYYYPAMIFDLFTIPAESSNERQDLFIPGSGSYSPLVYAPQALAVFLAREFLGSVGSVYYSARLGALIFTIICGVAALKLLPEKKLLLFIISFSPMFLFETASCSADPVIYSISILATAYLLSLRKSSTPVSKTEILYMSLLAIALGLSKQVYGTILFLYLLIPMKKFGDRRRFYAFGLYLVALFLISALGWMQFAKAGLEVFPAVSPEANIPAQVNFIASHPFQFLKVCFTTFETYFAGWYAGFVGVLGWLVLRFPYWFYAVYGALFLIGGLTGDLKLTARQRLIMLFGIVPTTLAMCLYFYITWSPVQNPIFGGMQGRYFIPMAFMFISALSALKNNPYENAFACFTASATAIFAIGHVIKHFY